MKKVTLITTLFISVLTYSQKTIFENMNSNNFQSINILPKGNKVIVGNKIYDSDGNIKNFIDSEINLGIIAVSNSEKAILSADISKSGFKQVIRYIIDGKIIELSKVDIKDTNFDFFGRYQNFSSKYEYNIKNEKDKFDVNFEKEDLYLSVKDMFTRKKEIFKLDTPNKSKFIGPDFIKVKEKLGYRLIVNFDESIDIVTKSISKDYTNTILYKTRFSNEGKKVNDLVFDLKIPNSTFLYSRNDGGNLRFAYNSNFMFFDDDLSINNYIEDKNGDIYIYGLFGGLNDYDKVNDNASPKGYYVFKYDKSGKKIWESINKLEDSDFNKGHVMTTVFLDLTQLNNNLCLSIKVNGIGDFFSYSIIDKVSGNVTKAQNLVFDQTFTQVDNTNNNKYKINSIYKKSIEFKNKEFNFESIIAINSNTKIEDYVKKITSKNDLFFKSTFSDKGVWLYETDNKDYYKVTLFKE